MTSTVEVRGLLAGQFVTAVLHDVTVEKTVVLNTVLVVSSTDPELPLPWALRLLAVLVEAVAPVLLTDEDEPSVVWELRLEAVLLVLVRPVTTLDEEEPAPEVLTVFEVVGGAGGAALRVLSAPLELTTEDKALGSSDRHFTLSLEPLLSV